MYGKTETTLAEATSPAREPGVTLQMQRIESALSDLHQTIEEFEERLNPVLRLSGPEGVNAKDPAPSPDCFHVGHLKKLAGGVAEATTRLRRLIDRLEV